MTTIVLGGLASFLLVGCVGLMTARTVKKELSIEGSNSFMDFIDKPIMENGEMLSQIMHNVPNDVVMHGESREELRFERDYATTKPQSERVISYFENEMDRESEKVEESESEEEGEEEEEKKTKGKFHLPIWIPNLFKKFWWLILLLILSLVLSLRGRKKNRRKSK